MIQTNNYGIYHGVNEGYCSWYEFVETIFEKAKINIKVNHIPSSEYPTKAKRPFNSRLAKGNLDKKGFKRMFSWQDALERYLKDCEECK